MALLLRSSKSAITTIINTRVEIAHRRTVIPNISAQKMRNCH